MGKRGPCFHCGIDDTPLWRNGPPEKPVLCNACGSRYRIRGTLENYIPKHILKKPRKFLNIVHNEGNLSMKEDGSGHVPDSIVSEDDTGNKSTSDSQSAITWGCTKLENVDDSEDEIPGYP
ncbi:GATA transcription factor 26-like [Quercus suber]|uniref:GATA transcription factor 26-like n=1 Tax=Quercus suber TaxID=58331 RepID=UPI0032DF35CB